MQQTQVYADLGAAGVISTLRTVVKDLAVGVPEWADLLPILKRAVKAFALRNTVVHSLWPAQPDGRLFAHRLLPEGAVATVEWSMDDLRRQVSELVELVGLMDAWRMRMPVRSSVERDRLAGLQTASPVPPVRLLNGSEPFEGLPEASVLDFWRWGMSDVRTNTLRGVVAEFLVARAVGSTLPHRIEWDSYDVVTPEGITIEVKSAAYLQAWEQKRASRIEFSGLTARRLDDVLGNYAGERGYNAEVYVFAVQTATEHAAFDVLDTNQWEFYVAPRAAVATTRRRSLGLAAVRAVAGEPVALQNLHGTIVRVHGSV